MYLSILIFPLLGSIASGFFGRKIGVTGSQIITCTCLILSSIMMTTAFYEVCITGSPVYIYLGSWIDSELLSISWEFYFDQLTVSLGLAVLYCSTLIHIYSIDYLSSDPAKCNGNTLLWVKLSNSGDSLKLMIPNYLWKHLSGWTNYSGMVTSHKMIENEMGYRGSKSDLLMGSVKEQRVDGSYLFKHNKLRCTLMGFERNYQIKIPSNQLNIKNFSTFSKVAHFHPFPCPATQVSVGIPFLKGKQRENVKPWFWTGLIDAEGSFSIFITKKIKRSLGWSIELKFQLGLHIRDIELLYQLQEYLEGAGKVYVNKTREVANYSLSSKKDLAVLINHLDNYPLLSQKKADWMFFKQAAELYFDKCHFLKEGLYKIVNIKASMNLGLSNNLKNEFDEFKIYNRPLIQTKNIPDPHWISGFVSGDGSFDINITKDPTAKQNYRVQLRFRITQHSRDIELMNTLTNYLNTGSIYKYPNQKALSLTVVNLSDIINKIIPFFDQNTILGVKQLDYLDWCKVANLMNSGFHLTSEGLNLIRQIKEKMNTNR